MNAEDQLAINLKGAIAESLVTLLFRHSNYSVKLHGNWKTTSFPSHAQGPLFRHDEREDHPDLLISGRGGKHLLEVKYRKYGQLLPSYDSNQKLIKQCEWWGNLKNTHGIPFSVIIVNQERPPFLSVLRAPFFQEGQFKERIQIEDAGWKLHAEVLIKCYSLLANGLFNGVS